MTATADLTAPDLLARITAGAPGPSPADLPAQRLLVLIIRTAGRIRYTVERPENYARSMRDALHHAMRRHGPHGLLRVQLIDGNETDIVVKTITEIELGPLPDSVRRGMDVASLHVHQLLDAPTAEQLLPLGEQVPR